MSADSPKRCAPNTVPPQAVSDRSVLDSVTGFLNDVTLTNVPPIDPTDSIMWARFETMADITDPTFGEDWDLEGGVAPPLLLLLGYGTGVQCWAIPANGEAIEVLSWRHGSVRALRILPLPIVDGGGGSDDGIDATATDMNDLYAAQRPLMAICDSNVTGSGPQFCAVNFISIRNGDQVKSIKFRNPVLYIMANRSAVVVTFAERIAVFDSRTLEDRLTITTCHPGTSLNPNPVALGTRWLAYAERKMLPSKRSCGGCDCDGVASYTATVLNAAKSLGKGLRELGEQMAAGFSGGSNSGGFGIAGGSIGSSSGTPPIDIQPGIVTIMDIKYSVKNTSPTTGAPVSASGADPIVAHFIAHSDAIVALEFDYSGMLLATADKRGHDFHIFRILPHPIGPSLSAVHHLYVLHRGDTTAKVQNIVFSLDSRWVAVSTLRGTTHVFPVTPYGGPAGVRTHGSPHVVNRLSRFHRSAGLSAEGRSNSPVYSSSEHSAFTQISSAYSNPRVPPFPHPTVVLPLAQLRQPASLGQANSFGSVTSKVSQHPHSNSRQRLTSLSDDASSKPLRVCATFAKARAWLLDPPGPARDIPSLRMQRKAVDSLFIMASHGALIQYDLEPKTNINIPKDKICDDTSIELEVEPKAQWNLLRKDGSLELQAPLPVESWLLRDRLVDASATDVGGGSHYCPSDSSIDDRDDRWLSQVEIITHAGPHRRLWMGPQFMFKTYNTPSGAPLSHIDIEAVEVGINSSGNRPARSNPMNMPLPGSGSRSAVPVLIESGSCSSLEQSPRLQEQYRHDHMGSDFSIGGGGDSQLREDLADAMRESPGRQSRDGGLPSVTSAPSSSSTTAPRNFIVSVGKVVNPLGTVTTVQQRTCHQGSDDPSAGDLDQFTYCGDGDEFIHENCDEALFRPVVTVFTTPVSHSCNMDEISNNNQPPAAIGQELIVPVIDKRVDDKREQAKKVAEAVVKKNDAQNVANFDAITPFNKKNKTTTVLAVVAATDSTKNIKELKKSDTRPPSNVEKYDRIESGKKGSDKNKKLKTQLVETQPLVAPVFLEKDRKAVKTTKEEEKLEEAKVLKKNLKKLAKETSPPNVSGPETEQVTIKIASKTTDIGQAEGNPSINCAKSHKLKSTEDKEPSLSTPNKQMQKTRKISNKFNEAPALSLLPDPIPLEDDLPLEMLSFADMMKAEFDVVKSAQSSSCKNSKKESTPEGFTPKDRSPSSISNDVTTQFNILLKPAKSNELADIVELVKVPRSDIELKKPIPSERASKKKSKPQGECLKSNEMPSFDFDTIDSVGLNVIECFEEECSSIQDSIFIDPVVTTTFVVKKGKKDKPPTFAELCSATNPIPSSRSLKLITEQEASQLDLVPLPQSSPPIEAAQDFDFSMHDMASFEDAFAPLEPFNLNFENLTLHASSSSDPNQFVSLINFQSPEQETAKPLDSKNKGARVTDTADDEKKLEFSLCKSFQSCEDHDYDDDDDVDPPALLLPCQDPDYKRLEQEMDDNFLSLELLPALAEDFEANSSSTDDTEQQSSPQQQQLKASGSTETPSMVHATISVDIQSLAVTATKYNQEDDEELQPLIGLSVSQEDPSTCDTTLPPEGSIDNDSNEMDSDKPQPGIAASGGSTSVTAVNKKKNKRKRR